jgi:hypothetical protein
MSKTKTKAVRLSEHELILINRHFGSFTLFCRYFIRQLEDERITSKIKDESSFLRLVSGGKNG